MDLRVLCAVGNDALHHRLEAGLSARGYRLTCVPADLRHLADGHVATADLVIIATASTGAPDETLMLLGRIRGSGTRVPIIVISRRSSESEALAVFRAGASDYLEESVSVEHLDVAMRLSLRRMPRPDTSNPSRSTFASRRILGHSSVMQETEAAVASIAAVDSNVLVTGETGTGKELVAECIHAQSARHRHSFVRVNCAAIPETLIESELFGHERGAFTGADSMRDGLVTLARDGTIFFDEIGDMSLAAQAKILRAIETKEVHRLGSKGGFSVNVRVIAATNRDIERMTAEGQFRLDLYFRLNVARIHLPPLRDRKEDIPLLCDHYIRRLHLAVAAAGSVSSPARRSSAVAERTRAPSGDAVLDKLEQEQGGRTAAVVADDSLPADGEVQNRAAAGRDIAPSGAIAAARDLPVSVNNRQRMKGLPELSPFMPMCPAKARDLRLALDRHGPRGCIVSGDGVCRRAADNRGVGDVTTAAFDHDVDEERLHLSDRHITQITCQRCRIAEDAATRVRQLHVSGFDGSPGTTPA